MNKDDYINEMDKIKAPEELKQRIMEAKNSSRNNTGKKRNKRIITIVASAAAVVLVFTGIISISSASAGLFENASSSIDSFTSHYGAAKKSSYSNDAVQDELAYTPEESGETNIAERKVVKNASLYVQTKLLTDFIESINEKTKKLGGYSESVEVSNYDSGSAELNIRIPAEKLEDFISAVEEIATVKSKNISSSDVTDSYIDVESNIKALETEEKALLGILEKCKSVSETIEVQDRLSQVRGKLESLKSQKASLDSQISYSRISISVSEEKRIIESDDSFSSRLKTKFEDSVYNISSFFETLAVNLFGGILYIILIGAVAAVVILIVRKKRKKSK